MPKSILETQRLTLREFDQADAGFIVELLNTPGWLEFIGERNVRTKRQAVSYLENGPMKSYRENGFGLYMVETKNSQTGVGMCGLLKRETLEVPDIGFAFLPQYTGKGYAFEVVSATLRHAKAGLNFSRILAMTKPENIRSIHLLTSLGFKFDKSITWSDEAELSLYSWSQGEDPCILTKTS